MDMIDRLFDILRDAGRHRYGESAVTQLQHALQCATLAEQAGARLSLIAAALLHDIGHLINPDDYPSALRGEDAWHETTGSAFLEPWFGEEVTIPVRLHVPAKRYLTAVEPDYFGGLSPASLHSLELQGGPFSAADAETFIAKPYAEEAVQLRRWDDGAKLKDAATPDLAHFRVHLEACRRVRPAA